MTSPFKKALRFLELTISEIYYRVVNIFPCHFIISFSGQNKKKKSRKKKKKKKNLFYFDDNNSNH